MFCYSWRVTFEEKNVNCAILRWYLEAMPNTLITFNTYRSVMTVFPSWEILGKSFFETSKRFWLVFLLLSWKKKPFTSSGSIFSLFALCLFFFLCKKLVDGREWSHNQQYAYNDCTYMYWQDAINNQTCLKKVKLNVLVCL